MKKSLILVLFLATIAIFLTFCYSRQENLISEIYSFNEVDFDRIPSSALVVFDVDETLIQPKDTYVLHAESPQAINFRKKLMEVYPEVTDWVYISSLVLQQAERPLIEPGIIEKIRDLQERNVPVIACTAMNTGPYGMFSKLEDWRYEHLKSLGFEGSFNTLTLEFEVSGHHPVFYKGILAADAAEKGPVIGAFLDAMKMHPTKIIFFDDSLNFLISVQDECRKRGIQFRGYHYKGAKEPDEKPWNESLIKLQADHLIRTQEWLADEEVQRGQLSQALDSTQRQHL